MTPLSADAKRTRKSDPLVSYPVKASAAIYKGALLCAAVANGFAIPGTDAAGRVFLGIAKEAVTGTASDGGVSVVTETAGRFEIAATSGAQTDVGKYAYLVDDGTVRTAPTTHGIIVGVVTRYISSTLLEVEIDLGPSVFGSLAGTPKIYSGIGAFTTTGTTKAVAAGGITTILAAHATFVGTHSAADGALGFAEDGSTGLPAVATDQVTVNRAAGDTSGAKFIYTLIGY